MSDSLYFDKTLTFDKIGLDRRVFKAVARQGFVHPTLVQAKCIPIILGGKDVMAQAQTGSGKTLAYAIPVVQSILQSMADGLGEEQRGVKAVILVPTRELCDQVKDTFQKLIHYCTDCITFTALYSDVLMSVQAPLLKVFHKFFTVGCLHH